MDIYKNNDLTEVIGSVNLLDNKNKKYMQGYKTSAGLIIIALGWLGLGDIISQDKVAEFINLGVQLVGILLATYGNYKAHKQIDKLGGY